MLTRRSGAPSRFLLYRASEHWVLRGDLFVYNVLLGLLPLLGVLFGFSSCGGDAVRSLLDPRDPIHLLARPLSPDERGAVHVRGRIQGAETCLLTHEHLNKGWSEDWVGHAGDGATILVERGEGAGAPAAGATLKIDWTSTLWEPRALLQVTNREEHWQARLSSHAGYHHPVPSGGRILEGCLHPGDPVFVDVSVDAENVPSVLTPGDGTPRLRLAQLRAAAVGQASLLGLAAIVVIVYLWRAVAARPFTATLLQRLSQPLVLTAAPLALLFLAVTPLLLLAGSWAVPRLTGADGAVVVDREPWACAHGAALAGLIVAVRMRDRRIALRASMKLVRAGACPPLERARDDEAVCLEATVDPGAPVSAGLLTGKPRAHWLVSVTRIYQAGQTSAAATEPARPGPLVVPLRGAGEGGAARLDLTHVAADLRAVRRVVRPRAARRGKHAQVIGAAPPAGSGYLLEERFLDPGEPVLVMGRVIRFESGASARVPVIGGTAAEPVLVHAGSRRSLLRGLAIERGFLLAAAPLCVAIALAIAALAAWSLGVTK